MSLQSATSGYNSEPNVIPMIDILLVLLIIFMMTIVQTRKAMDVQVPSSETAEEQQASDESDQIVLELKEDGTYEINAAPYLKSELDAAFHEIYDNRPAKLMFVKTARNRSYQDVVEAMDIARAAGVQVIGFTPKAAQAAEGGG
jgi:biopolymer transport protein ExbD